MSNNVYYFSHDSNARNDEKILMLRAENGIAGYGIFWALIEMMFETEDTKLYHDKIKGIAMSFNIDITVLSKVITCCVNEGLFESDGKCFWSNSLIRRKNKFYELKEKRSQAGIKGMEKRWKKDGDNSVITKNNKGKESKVKESKVKEDNTDASSDKSSDNGFDENIADKRKRLKLAKDTKLFPEQYSDLKFKEIVSEAVRWLQHNKDESCISAPVSEEELFNTQESQKQIDIYYRGVFKHPDAKARGFDNLKKTKQYWEWLLKERSEHAGCDWKNKMAGKWLRFKFIFQTSIKNDTKWNLAQDWEEGQTPDDQMAKNSRELDRIMAENEKKDKVKFF